MPNRFYFNVESAGPLPPDTIVGEGIKVLQLKLAELVRELSDGDEGANGGYDGPRSPDAEWGQEQGYTTPYGNGGNQSTWGGAGGGTTPYGQTPYGGSGGGWS